MKLWGRREAEDREGAGNASEDARKSSLPRQRQERETRGEGTPPAPRHAQAAVPAVPVKCQALGSTAKLPHASPDVGPSMLLVHGA